MKKIILAIALITILPMTAFADKTFYTAQQSNAQSGVIIVPLSKMNPSNETLSFLEQQKTKGYSIKESNDAIDMLKAGKQNYSNEINDTSDPTDTHMKSDLSKIKLAFQVKPIPFIKPIGFAVGGKYIENSGWTAISMFFNDKNIGACRYKLNNMKISDGAVLIPEETVQHDINNKITNIFVEGSVRSGFIYNVNWNDATYNHFLECANMKYDHNITSQMIELAKKIDKNIS